MNIRVDLCVIGGGITGLSAAWEAARAGATVTIVEPGPLGGKVRASAFGGGVLDEGADAFLARVPEGIELCRQLGVEGELVSPAARRAYIWSDGALRPLPEAQVLGVPTDLDELAGTGLISPQGIERARRDLREPLPRLEHDVTIGTLVRDRLGDEVLERLVDPLVGGINAGVCDELSLAAATPQLDAAARSGAASLIEACGAQRAAVADPAAPVFFAPRGGVGSLVDRLGQALLERGTTALPTTAEGIQRDAHGWRVDTSAGGSVGAGSVLLAAPATAAASLLRPHAPRAATLLAAIPYASVVLVSLAVPGEAIGREVDASGYLIPAVEGRLVTACSWVSAKWDHLGAPGTVWLRASAGRDGDGRALKLDDGALVDAVLADLADTMALRGTPTEVRVSRWPASLPQYRPGHLERLDAIDADLGHATPGIAAAGAFARGLGVPACIRQGRAAARRLLALEDHARQ